MVVVKATVVLLSEFVVTTNSGILFWAIAKVVGIKGGGGPKGVDPGGGPKGADPAGTDRPSGPNVIGTCFEGTDLASLFSGAPAPAFAAAFSRNFLKYSLAALIFLR